MKFVELSDETLGLFRVFLSKIGHDPGGADLRSSFDYYSPSPGITLRQHLVIEDSGPEPLVVGAARVKVQTYWVAGKSIEAAVVVYPVSLGIVDPRYSMVGVFLFRKLDQTYPYNILLGMGPPETSAAAKLTSLLGWRLDPIPYLFLPIRLGPLVAKKLETKPLFARAATLAGKLGLFYPVQALLALRAARSGERSLRISVVATFGPPLDQFWAEYATEVGFSLQRTCDAMNAMFPVHVPQFERLMFFDGDAPVGFAVLLIPPGDHPRFGGIATLVEFSVLDDRLDAAAEALTRNLRRRKLTAVLANTPHARTISALKSQGFRERVTSVYLATSKALNRLLVAEGVALGDMVVSRGDGDGPVGLGVDL